MEKDLTVIQKEYAITMEEIKKPLGDLKRKFPSKQSYSGSNW